MIRDSRSPICESSHTPLRQPSAGSPRSIRYAAANGPRYASTRHRECDSNLRSRSRGPTVAFLYRWKDRKDQSREASVGHPLDVAPTSGIPVQSFAHPSTTTFSATLRTRSISANTSSGDCGPPAVAEEISIARMMSPAKAWQRKINIVSNMTATEYA